jgi:hypothetical protein
MNATWRVATRRHFRVALAVSLLFHGAILLMPGWHVPWLDHKSELPLEATLVIPVRPEPVSVPQPVPQPAPKPQPAPVRPASADAPRVESPPAQEKIPTLPPPPPQPGPVVAPAEPPPVAVPPAPSFAGTWPTHGRIRFSVTRGEQGLVIGQAEHEWWHDADTYRLRATTETTGLAALIKPIKVVQESQGIFVPGGLQPLEFKKESGGKLKQSLRFDPSQKRVFSSNGASYEMLAQTHDLLSLFFQLGAMPLDAPGMYLNVAGGRKAERYEIIALDIAPIETPFGTRTAQHLKLPGTQAGDGEDTGESTEVWLDTVSRLPLRIRYRDRKGETYDQTATAVEVDNTP